MHLTRTAKLILTIVFILFVVETNAQGNRINSQENIGWYNYFGTFKINDNFGLHTEYQWRRDNFIQSWQQGLFRVGVNYHLNLRVLFRLGYAWIETYPYGEFPINGLGRDFTEHRIFQMAQLGHQEGLLQISHRFMVEQRFIGRYSNADLVSEDQFPLSHRMRYMLRLQMPLSGKQILDRTPYLAVYNEVFIGFGNNVNANIFDQNRVGVLFGYRINKNVSLEAGYLNQIIQFGRQIEENNIFQNNHGFIINTNLNFDLTKKKDTIR